MDISQSSDVMIQRISQDLEYLRTQFKAVMDEIVGEMEESLSSVAQKTAEAVVESLGMITEQLSDTNVSIPVDIDLSGFERAVDSIDIDAIHSNQESWREISGSINNASDSAAILGGLISGPIGIAAGILAASLKVTSGIMDIYSNSLDNNAEKQIGAIEAVMKAQKAIESQEQKIESTNAQILENNKSIEELNGLDAPSVADQNETKRIKSENERLRLQLSIEKDRLNELQNDEKQAKTDSLKMPISNLEELLSGYFNQLDEVNESEKIYQESAEMVKSGNVSVDEKTAQERLKGQYYHVQENKDYLNAEIARLKGNSDEIFDSLKILDDLSAVIADVDTEESRKQLERIDELRTVVYSQLAPQWGITPAMEEYPEPPEPEPPKGRVPTPWEIEEKSKAADYIRQEKTDAEQRERDTRRLQEGWTSAQHQYLTGEIKSEKALYDELSRLFKNYGNESNKDHWRYQEDLAAMKRKFDQEAADAEDRRLEESKAKQDEAAQIAKDGLLAEQEDVKDHLETIVKDYNSSFDELEKQRETYKKRLMAEAGDLFSVTTETRDDGVEVTTFALENIDEQIKKMRDYHADMKMLRFDGASFSLLNEINSLGPGDGTRFADEIANMSDAEREQLYDLYEERDKIADELSADLFKDEADLIQSVFNEKYNIISEEAYAAGVNAGDEFADGFHNGLNEIMGGLQSEIFADLYKISASLAPVPMFVHSQPSGGGDGNGGAERPIVIESHVKTDFNLDGRKLGEVTYHYIKETERISGG